MPIDSFILGPMISPYENMIKDVETRGIENEHVDKMREAFARMKQLGEEHSDIGAFSGICMQEDLFGSFSTYYSQALAAQSSSSGSDGSDYDDAALLKQAVQGLKQAIEQIKNSKEAALAEAAKDPKANLANEAAFASRMAGQYGLEITASDIEKEQSQEIDKELAKNPNAYNNVAEVEALDNSAEIIQPIEDLIALGEQKGMTFPNFLRIQIEKGLDKAMEGAVSTRNALEYELGWAKASSLSPYHIAKCEKKLNVFDELASKQKFGVPNWTELKWANNDIDYEFEPDIIKWKEITNRWDDLLYDLSIWSLAHCSHAEYRDPWLPMPRNLRPEAIQKAKDTLPGVIKQKERLLEKYFGITFHDIFEHKTFKWAVEKNNLHYSKEFITFLKDKVYDACIPLQYLPDDLTTERERISKENLEVNPKITEPAERNKAYYDEKFGSGRYVSKFGEIQPVDSNAAPWN